MPPPKLHAVCTELYRMERPCQGHALAFSPITKATMGSCGPCAVVIIKLSSQTCMLIDDGMSKSKIGQASRAQQRPGFCGKGLSREWGRVRSSGMPHLNMPLVSVASAFPSVSLSGGLALTLCYRSLTLQEDVRRTKKHWELTSGGSLDRMSGKCGR